MQRDVFHIAPSLCVIRRHLFVARATAGKCMLDEAAHPMAILCIKGKRIARASPLAVAVAGHTARMWVLTVTTGHVLPLPRTLYI